MPQIIPEFGKAFKIDVVSTWNREEMIAAFKQGCKHPLAQAGALVRRIATRRIRRRKKPSKPGQSPTSWTDLLRKNIFFVVLLEKKKVIIGPALFSSMNMPGRQPIPSVLEHGGNVSDSIPQQKKKHRERRRGYVHVAPRPYMRPALKIAMRYLPRMFINMLKRRR